MQIINLDLSVRSNIPPLHAKQGDVGRKFMAILTDGGVVYPVPAGAAVSVWYSGASGDGNYTDIGADSAVSVSGNEITVELITQMLANYGEGKLCLAINTADGDQIGTWNIPYMVEPLPGMGSAAAQQYFTAFSQAVQTLPYPDVSLSVAGKAADAAAVGAALAAKAPAIESAEHPGCYYRVVNGITEWLNPPMVAGIEYRTTKRWRGKPVYAMTINGGGLPAGGNATVTIPASGTTQDIISINGSGYGSRYFPSTKIAGGAMSVEFETGINNIGVYVSQDFLGGLEYFITIEYTLA